jgi:6-phosphogluconolactonase (cycloisomerase 2 family)
LTIDSQRRLIYVGLRDGPNALVTYAIDGWTGTLTPVPCSELAAPPTTELPGSPQPGERLTFAGIVFHPSVHLAYVAFDYYYDYGICGVETWIFAYSVDAAAGRLTRLDLPPVSVGRTGDGDIPPDGLSAVSSIAGSYLYATNRGSPGGVCPMNSELSGFEVDSASGRLRRLHAPFPIGSPNDGDGHRWLLLAPPGDVLYIARQQDTVQYEIQAARGALQERGTSPRVGPAMFSPAGRLYSAVGIDDVPGVRVFEVEPSTRALVPVSNGFAATQSPVGSLAIDSSGRFLCAVQSEAGMLSVFTIDTASGRPQPASGPPTLVGSDRFDPDFRIVAIADIR